MFKIGENHFGYYVAVKDEGIGGYLINGNIEDFWSLTGYYKTREEAQLAIEKYKENKEDKEDKESKENSTKVNEVPIAFTEPQAKKLQCMLADLSDKHQYAGYQELLSVVNASLLKHFLGRVGSA